MTYSKSAVGYPALSSGSVDPSSVGGSRVNEGSLASGFLSKVYGPSNSSKVYTISGKSPFSSVLPTLKSDYDQWLKSSNPYESELAGAKSYKSLLELSSKYFLESKEAKDKLAGLDSELTGIWSNTSGTSWTPYEFRFSYFASRWAVGWKPEVGVYMTQAEADKINAAEKVYYAKKAAYTSRVTEAEKASKEVKDLSSKIPPKFYRDYSKEITAAQVGRKGLLNTQFGPEVYGDEYLVPLIMDTKLLSWRDIPSSVIGSSGLQYSDKGILGYWLDRWMHDPTIISNNEKDGPFITKLIYTYNKYIKPTDDSIAELKSRPLVIDNPSYLSSLDIIKDRVKSLDEANSLYISNFDKSKSDKLSLIKSLEAIPSSVSYSSGYTKGRSPNVSSKALPGLPPVGSDFRSGGRPFDAYFSSNPYSSSIASLEASRLDWESKLVSNPFKASDESLKTSKEEYTKALPDFIKGNLGGMSEFSYFLPAIESGYLYLDPEDFKLKIDTTKANPTLYWGFGPNPDIKYNALIADWGSLIEGKAPVNSLRSQTPITSISGLVEWKDSYSGIKASESQLKDVKSYYEIDKARTRSDFSSSKSYLDSLSKGYESSKSSYKEEISNVESSRPPIVKDYRGLSEAQSAILKAVLEGQRDIKSLSTYSGLRVPEVKRILSYLQNSNRLEGISLVDTSRVTKGDISGSSKNFWKRVTSI